MSAVAIDDLRFPQQFVLWASRQWVVSQPLPHWRDQLLLGGFSRLGIPAAALELDQLLAALIDGSHYQPMFLRPCRQWLSEDEHAYLEILCALQRGLNGTATERLGHWCPPTSLRLALTAGKRMTTLLSEAGLELGAAARQIRLPREPTSVHSALH